MKLKTLLVLIASSLLAVACGNDSGSKSEPAGAIEQQADEVTELISSGDMTAKSDVVAVDVAFMDMDEATDEEKAEVYTMYPDLARDVATLRSIDWVAETSAGKLDLYAGENLVMILANGQSGWMVESSSTTFTPVSIEHVMSGQGQQEELSALRFTLQSCTVEEQEQEQEQEQGKEQQEQGKEQQEQGKEQQEQGKEQQEQGKEQQEQSKETCASVVVTLTLDRVVEEEKQEQEQGKEQQEQGKAQEEQAKEQEQEQEQAQEEDKDQEEEEDKGQDNQDQA